MEWNINKTISFIEDYRNCPELWDAQDVNYKDADKRNQAFELLSNKYECSVDDVKKKIKNLRSAFHRERKKICLKSDSLRNKSRWFAYDSLLFLKNEDIPKETIIINNDEDSEIENVVIQETDVSDSNRSPQSENGNEWKESEPENRKHRRKFSTSSTEQEKETYSILPQYAHRDECSVYGEYVESELRNLSPEIRPIVKHMINNILFKAAVGIYNNNGSSSRYKKQRNYL